MDDLWDNASDLLIKLLHSPGWKVAGASLLALLQTLFGDTMRPALSAIVILCVTDFILGFGFATVKHEWASNRLLRGAIKWVIYANLLLVGAQIAKINILGTAFVGQAVAGLIDGYVVLTEAISVLEKVDKWAHLAGVKLIFLNRLIRYLKAARDRGPEELLKGGMDRGTDSSKR